MDSSSELVANETRWIDLATRISETEPGLMQMKHRLRLFEEFGSIVLFQKDYPLNVVRTIDWLQKQPDYEEYITVYDNQVFGYDPSSATYQHVSQAFWRHYSLELDSWRDQPLWAFMLYRYNVTPIPFPVSSKNELWTIPFGRQGYNNHEYRSEMDVHVKST